MAVTAARVELVGQRQRHITDEDSTIKDDYLKAREREVESLIDNSSQADDEANRQFQLLNRQRRLLRFTVFDISVAYEIGKTYGIVDTRTTGQGGPRFGADPTTTITAVLIGREDHPDLEEVDLLFWY